MTSPENQKESPENNNSLLAEILSQSSKKEEEKQTATWTTETQWWWDSAPPSPQKKWDPIPPGMILRAIGVLIWVATIVFASFLAYIVFNPDDARFFITMFGIDTKDVATILRKLINGSFGIIILIFSIIWIVSLFRAIWTPSDQKRKKLLWWITAWLVWIMLFSLLAFWSFLFKKIWETVWDGWVINIYDNDLYTNPVSREFSEIQSTSNIIGPITLRYDISGNAKKLSSNGLIKIQSYEMNFDGATCNNGKTSIVNWSDPEQEKSITCVFDTIRVYNVRGSYRGIDVSGNEKEIPMEISPVEIRWILDIKKQKNTSGNDIITFDATKLKLLGSPRWGEIGSSTENASSSVTYEPSQTSILVWLKVFWERYDRLFIIQKQETISTEGKIIYAQNVNNALNYSFKLDGTKNIESNITKVNWIVDDGSIICKDGSEVCEYTFWSYGKRQVRAVITLADGTDLTLSVDVLVEEPLVLARHVTVSDRSGKKLNPDDTYDGVLRAYVIENIIPPEMLTLDARDVVTVNPGYKLKDVRWFFSDGKTTQEKQGERVTFEIANTFRYTVNIAYTFEKTIIGTATTEEQARESVIIDVEHKSLIPRIQIQKTGDYVPVKVTVDGSQSRSENGEIKKFVWNFWEGKPDAIWDALQTYEYTTPGEKEITLTVIWETGEKSTTKTTLVLKEAPKTLNFTSSISPAVIGIPVDFTVTDESGQVENYIWSFGDNTPSERGISVTHSFASAWEYQIILTAIYVDWTQKQATQKFRVQNSLE